MAGESVEAGQEKEPMLLLDTTGSMNYPTAESDTTPRKDTIKEAIGSSWPRWRPKTARPPRRRGAAGCAP